MLYNFILGKYGLDVTVEYKGAFVYVQDENKENQNEELDFFFFFLKSLSNFFN